MRGSASRPCCCTRSPTRSSWPSRSPPTSEDRRVLRRVGLLAGALLLLTPQAAFAKGEFHPEEEWDLHDWVSIHLGPLNLSINKAVVYLLLSAVVTMVLGIVLMRVRLGTTPGRRQTVGETIYEVAQTQVAEQGL